MNEAVLRWLEEHERSISWLARQLRAAATQSGMRPVAYSGVWRRLHGELNWRTHEIALLGTLTGLELRAERMNEGGGEHESTAAR